MLEDFRAQGTADPVEMFKAKRASIYAEGLSEEDLLQQAKMVGTILGQGQKGTGFGSSTQMTNPQMIENFISHGLALLQVALKMNYDTEAISQIYADANILDEIEMQEKIMPPWDDSITKAVQPITTPQPGKITRH